MKGIEKEENCQGSSKYSIATTVDSYCKSG